MSVRRSAYTAIAGLSLVLCWSLKAGAAEPSTGTTTFVFDGNRMYAPLGFVRPDGSVHPALAFVDMGSQFMEVRASLFRELQLDGNQPLSFRMGGLTVRVARGQVVKEDRPPSSIGSSLKVEATLPASVLQAFQVVIDYGHRTLTLATPATVKLEGSAVPFRINSTTGLIVIDASIDGSAYPFTVDNGSAYTWVKESAAQRWIIHHPAWKRGVGAVGPSNMMMSGDGTETAGTLLRLRELSIGPVSLKAIGALAAGPSSAWPGNRELFDWYSEKNPEPVIGWIGANVLKHFRLTIDYPSRLSYWVKQSDPDPHDLDQIGLTLKRDGEAYVIVAVAIQNGLPTVNGIRPGDKLIRVGDVNLANATWGAVYDAMHGPPGTTRVLVVERNGTHVTVAAKITRF